MAIQPEIGSVVTVAVAGTAVQVTSTDLVVTNIIFEADSANAGKVFIGDSTVDSTNGISLDADQTLSYSSLEPQTDEFVLSDFWVDAANNGDKVRVQYTRRRL